MFIGRMMFQIQRKPHFNKKQLYRRGPQINSTLETISQILKDLLEEINQLYQKNGIVYRVQMLHEVIYRLVAPHQILGYLGIADHSNLVKVKQQIKPKFKKKVQQNSQGKGLNFNVMPAKSHNIVNSFPSQLDSFSLQNKKLHFQNPYETYQSHENKQPRRRNILTQNQELDIVDWAINKLDNGERVMRNDLARRAIKLSKGAFGFKASKGWSNKFLNRHKLLKERLQQVSRFNIGIRGYQIPDSDEEKYASNDMSKEEYQNGKSNHKSNELNENSELLSEDSYSNNCKVFDDEQNESENIQKMEKFEKQTLRCKEDFMEEQKKDTIFRKINSKYNFKAYSQNDTNNFVDFNGES